MRNEMELIKPIKLRTGVKEMTFKQCHKQFERFLYSISKAYENTGYPWDELQQLCLIGLWKAYVSYDIEKTVLFMTYANRCIFNEINMDLRKSKKKLFEISFNEALRTDTDGNQLILSDIIGDSSFEDYQLLKIELEKFLSKLHGKDRYIINAISQDKTQNEIAAELKISQSYASRLMTRLKQRLKTQVGINIER